MTTQKPHVRVALQKFWLLILAIIAAPTFCTGTETSNRTLLGNKAVQEELKLTADQQAKIAAILSELEDEIEGSLKAQSADGKESDDIDESEIVNSALAKYGPRLQAVLDKDQANRLWQIGAQASGLAVFNNNRTRRVLNLNRSQQEKMADLSDKMVQEVTQLATDPTKNIKEIQEKAKLAEENCRKEYLKLLTDEQRRRFDELLGKPFDLDLLKHADGKKRRSLTFIFGLTGETQFVLTSQPDVRKELALTAEQAEQIQSLAKKADQDVTALRLSTLNAVKADFSEVKDEEKTRIAKTILDGAASINRETNDKVWQILNSEQRDVLNKRLVQLIGARALDSQPIAALLKLTPEQKTAYAKLSAEFDTKTATLRVVRNPTDFDQQTFDKHLSELEKAIRAILTAEQSQQLDKLAK